jgi:hypothetical protein
VRGPQAVKIESIVKRAAVQKGMKSTSRPNSRPSTVTGSADSNPHALRSADRREEVVAGGVAVVDKWAPLERPDEMATAKVDKGKIKSIKRDVPFALRRGTIGQVTTLHALGGYARPARARPPRIRRSSLS